MNANTNRVTQAPEVVARFAELGAYPRRDTPSGARDFLTAQQRAMKKQVNDLGLLAQ